MNLFKAQAMDQETLSTFTLQCDKFENGTFQIDLCNNFSLFIVNFLDFLPRLIVAIIVFLVFYLISQLSGFFTNILLPKNLEKTTASFLIKNIIKFSVLVIGTVSSLVIIGVDLSALIASLGLAGVALGFAFKDIFQNFISGTMILLQKPFVIGDVIEVDNKKGIVKSISNRYTILKTFRGEQIILPNNMLLSKQIIRYTAYENRRTEVQVRLAPTSNLDDVIQMGIDTIKHTKGVANKPEPFASVVTVSGESIELKFKFWFHARTKETFHIKSNVLRKIKREFEKNNIELAVPVSRLLGSNDSPKNPS